MNTQTRSRNVRAAVEESAPIQGGGYVTVRRVSDNEQKVSFGDAYLQSFHYRDEKGVLKRCTFLNAAKKESALVIGGGGKVTLYKDRFPDSHNIESLKTMLAAKPCPLGPNMQLELIDHDVASEDANELRRLRIKAVSRVDEAVLQSPEFLIGMARRLGIGPELINLTQAQVLDYVMGKAEADPALVMAIMDDANQQDRFDIDTAKAVGIFEQKGDYFYYGGQLLGREDDEIFAQLQRNPDVLDEVRRRVSRQNSRTGGTNGTVVAGSVKIDPSQMDLPELGGAGAAGEDEFNPNDGMSSSPIDAAKFLKQCQETMVPGEGGKLVPLVTYEGTGKGYRYGTLTLGPSKLEAGDFLLANPTIRQQLERLVAAHKNK